MPNIHLTDPMRDYAQTRIKTGAYANLSEVVRAGLRLLMEKEGARQFYSLKTDLDTATQAAARGEFTDFDPHAFKA